MPPLIQRHDLTGEMRLRIALGLNLPYDRRPLSRGSLWRRRCYGSVDTGRHVLDRLSWSTCIPGHFFSSRMLFAANPVSM